jgi:hypothetical protein
MMNQVIVGVFATWRDGHDALRALQLAGLSRDDAHLYRVGQHEPDLSVCPPCTLDEDDAEYVAHGEHQGVIGARHRFISDDAARQTASPCEAKAPDDSTRERTLLVIKITDAIKPGAVGDVLHEHGAIAVKDAAGHWRFSPFRNAAKV